jgi:uncharacterized peroxidase-related enzyme
MKKQISRFSIPEVNELPEDVQAIVNGTKEELGFVPNVIKALSHRPEQLKAFLAYDAVLTAKDSGITAAEREMIIVTFSGRNGCSYCVQSHGAQLRVHSGNSYISDQVAINYKEADITEREHAMLDFAMKITFDSASVNENDFKALKVHGFSDDDIWDIASITAFYNMSNRMMSVLAVHPDEEFSLMGRS